MCLCRGFNGSSKNAGRILSAIESRSSIPVLSTPLVFVSATLARLTNNSTKHRNTTVRLNKDVTGRLKH